MVWGFNKGDGYHMLSLYFPPKKGVPRNMSKNIPKVNHQELNIEDTGYMTHRGLQFASPKPGPNTFTKPAFVRKRVRSASWSNGSAATWPKELRCAIQNGAPSKMGIVIQWIGGWGKNLHRKPMGFLWVFNIN